jgi:putative two-component system response regulator
MSRGLDAGVFWVAATNRLIAIAAIWATAFLCILRQRQASKESQITFERETAKEENESLRRTEAVLARKIEELSAAQDAVVYALARTAESRDMETGQHLERIRAYSQILAEELRKEGAFAQVIDDEFVAHLYRASPLHDIGKVCIRDSVLHNQGRLDPEEYELMKRHTTIGSDILEDTMSRLKDAEFLDMAALVAHYHHERFDGGGYPEGLSGGVIPLAARIVSLADVYDALVSERPYREAHSPAEARRLIEAESGRQFDPRVVGAFLRRLDDLVEVQSRYPNKYVRVFDSAPGPDCELSQR